MEVIIRHIINRIILGSILVLSLFLTACDDNFTDKIDTRTNPPVAPDSISPIPGNSGTIFVDDKSEKSISIKWTKGIDNITSQSNLKYRVYISESNNISNFSEAELNGDQVTIDWEQDIDAMDVLNLEPDALYYFNVFIKDEDSNISSYTTSAVKTDESTQHQEDEIPPVPGGIGVISASNATSDSVTLSWSKGTDNVTDQQDLSYVVYMSEEPNINIYSNMMDNGDECTAGWTLDINSFTCTGLDPDRKYYFNIAVKDNSDNAEVYNMNDFKTLPLSNIHSPIPGNSGIISILDTFHDSISIAWTEGTDDLTDQSLLEYIVYVSTSSNISNLAEAEDNGFQGTNGWERNINSAIIHDLKPDTIYYFIVFIKDDESNVSPYLISSASTED